LRRKTLSVACRSFSVEFPFMVGLLIALLVPAAFAHSASTTRVPATSPGQSSIIFRGGCDASAAVVIPGANLVVIANDEDNVLRAYPLTGGDPVEQIDLREHHPHQKGKNRELDIEGGTVVGTTSYWIASHGANKKGKAKPARRQLFALDFSADNGRLRAVAVGVPYTKLLEDIEADARLSALDAANAARRPPEAPNTMNIEGLAATPDGALLIGLRNPIPLGKAVLIPLLNPREVVEGRGRARLGPPIYLDLGGRGIRSIEYIDGTREYLIAAGPYDGSGDFTIFTWSGAPDAAPAPVPALANQYRGLDVEALAPLSSSNRVLALSDDGTRAVDGRECKAAQPNRRASRGTMIQIPSIPLQTRPKH
jgi:hypothetical protein